MAEYKIEDIRGMQAKIKELEGTISEFRKGGCAIPRCKKCGEPLDELYEDEKERIHLSCENCGWTDWKDTKIEHACGKRWIKRLCEEEGIETEET